MSLAQALYTVSGKSKLCGAPPFFHFFGLLTGAVRSRASVYALAKRGPKAIYATDLTLDNLEELAKDVEKQYPGVQCIPRAVDAASTAGVTGIINEAMEKFGRLDVFFANAGIASGTMLHAEDEVSFMTMMRVNALRCGFTNCS